MFGSVLAPSGVKWKDEFGKCADKVAKSAMVGGVLGAGMDLATGGVFVGAWTAAGSAGAAVAGDPARVLSMQGSMSIGTIYRCEAPIWNIMHSLWSAQSMGVPH